jgi:hypothetical protein
MPTTPPAARGAETPSASTAPTSTPSATSAGRGGSATPSSAAPPAVTATGASPQARAELTNNAQRWLDAYYRQDWAAMGVFATRDMKVDDERTWNERLPNGLAARRSLEGVNFQFVGDNAILTARMTEQASVRGEPLQYVSYISQMWSREGGLWRLMDVRILSENKLK